MKGWRVLIILAVAVSFVACGGCRDDKDGNDGGAPSLGPAPHATQFFEPAPREAQLREHVANLKTELEPLVDADTRAAIDEYAAPYGAVGGLEPLDSADAYLGVGEAAFLMGSESAALWAFLNAVELDLDNVLALSQLGFILGYTERYNAARPFLLYAYSLDEEQHFVLENLAHNYRMLEEVERCIYYLERATILQPDNGHIRHKLAKCYFLGGYEQAGQDTLEIAQRLAPYDDDIADTAGEPPASVVEEDEGGGAIFDGTSGNEADAGKLIEAVGECHQQLIQDYGEYVTPYSGFGGEFMQAEGDLDQIVGENSYWRMQCEIKCGMDHPPGGIYDACIAGCLASECASDMLAFGEFRRRILSSRSKWMGAEGFVTSGFAGCAWPEYFRLKFRVAAFERQTAGQLIWTQLEQAQQTRLVTWADVDETIQLWEADIWALCTDAEAAALEIDWETAQYFDPFKDLNVKICSPLSGSLCVEITNTTVKVTTPVFIGSPLNLEFTFDARSGKFNATLSVPLASKSAPGGVVEGGINLKLDMQKGVGVETTGKVGGPLESTNWKHKQDHYPFSNDF